MPTPWCLIFSDGTGQRGVRDDDSVKNTNVFQMFVAAENKIYLETFYDPGLGAPDEGQRNLRRVLRDWWSKATGWGITANIVDCYEALILKWRPGMKIGLFGFSRGAFTVRCLSGVLATCGIAQTDNGVPISRDEKGEGAKRRRAIAEEGVAAYKLKDMRARKETGEAFRRAYGAVDEVADVVGVYDTVKALGLPGVTNLVNPWQFDFHDTSLSPRVPLGLQALSVDENRKVFAPVLWNAPAPGQRIEQAWFPGVHSDVGGGYADDWRLADLSLDWMLSRLRDEAGLHIPLTVSMNDNLVGRAHDERTGFGIFWLPAERVVTRAASLCDNIEARFKRMVPPYRPAPLKGHSRVKRFYP